MQTTSLDPFGIEIIGVDLQQPLADHEASVLRQLLNAHGLVLFRGQDISGADQRAAMELLGPVLDEGGDGRGFTLVSNVDEAGRLGSGRYLFHSDLAFTPEPIRYLSLCAIEVPDSGAPTWFADARRAAAALSESAYSVFGSCEAVHVFDLRSAAGDQRFRIADLPRGAPQARHPALLPHPDTGAPILYVSEMQTDHLVGMSSEESEQLLAEAFATLYRPENCYEHRWRPGDLVVWDNLALQHGRGPIVDGDRRSLRRVAVGTLRVELIITDADPDEAEVG